MKTAFEEELAEIWKKNAEKDGGRSFINKVDKEHSRRAKNNKDEYVALLFAREPSLMFLDPFTRARVDLYWMIGTPEPLMIDDYKVSTKREFVQRPSRVIFGGEDWNRNPFIFKTEFEALIFVEMFNSAACNVLKKISLKP